VTHHSSGVQVVVWVKQTAQLGIPCLRQRVEPAIKSILQVEDDGLSVIQPHIAAAHSCCHSRECPEQIGLACITKLASSSALFYSGTNRKLVLTTQGGKSG